MEFHLFTKFNGFVTDIAIMYFFIIPYVWDKSGDIIGSYGYDSKSEVYRTLLCFCFSTLVNLVESIPKSLYKQFVIDERHGFNKMTI